MSKRRHHRRLSLFAVLVLVFAQLSLSAYACVNLVEGHSPEAVMQIPVQSDCHGHAVPAGADLLCAFHCQDAVTLPSAPMPDQAPASAMPPLVVDVRGEPPTRMLAATPEASLVLALTPALYERYCRFLI